jgi:hypothetical protein
MEAMGRSHDDRATGQEKEIGYLASSAGCGGSSRSFISREQDNNDTRDSHFHRTFIVVCGPWDSSSTTSAAFSATPLFHYHLQIHKRRNNRPRRHTCGPLLEKSGRMRPWPIGPTTIFVSLWAIWIRPLPTPNCISTLASTRACSASASFVTTRPKFRKATVLFPCTMRSNVRRHCANKIKRGWAVDRYGSNAAIGKIENGKNDKRKTKRLDDEKYVAGSRSAFIPHTPRIGHVATKLDNSKRVLECPDHQR